MNRSNPVSQIYLRIRNQRSAPRWMIFSIDLILCGWALSIAYLLRFNIVFEDAFQNNFLTPLLLLTTINALVFAGLKTYKGVIRLSGIHELVRVGTAVLITAAIFMLWNGLSMMTDMAYFIPTSVLIIYFFTATFSLFGYRLLIKLVYYRSISGMYKSDPVLVVCKTANTQMYKNAVESISKKPYKVVGFIDEDNIFSGKSVEGTPVFSFEQLESVSEKLKIERIFISKEDVSFDFRAKIAEYGLTNNVDIKMMPRVEKWVDGQLKKAQIKDLKIEDLLNRPSIQIAPDHIRDYLKGKRVLVTGAAGSIGSEIVRQVAKTDIELLVLCDNRETGLYELDYELQEAGCRENVVVNIGDVRSTDAMRSLFMTYKPQVVFHAAAYKHVPLMEQHPCQAVRNNVFGTKVVADLAVEFGVDRFVFISTDKAINPTNVMGASKRIAEMYVAELQTLQQKTAAEISEAGIAMNQSALLNGHTKFITTRFGNVLGSNGSVIPRFQQQIEKGGPVTVTHKEITRYFMTIPEACSLVLEAGTMGHGGEIFVFDMGAPVKIADLALKMIKLAGMIPGKDIELRYSGLRPGEKLYEELLNQHEEVKPTHHKKIMISQVCESRPKSFMRDMEELIRIAESNRNFTLVRQMKLMVQEYKSNNSIYEKLDEEIKDVKNDKELMSIN